ncbi:hypothetical protein DES39_1877 [Orbus hercynius]|uniref:Uncharacterized protein n=1 Tax=Orbus hercynius TaxID=593135 RepID=A0A495RB71_9GAMM|nr:hypothetical protein [Orbus hercynius]RKS84665.1 hypothetical protein DES39_1877 [Orbus hercynius]
MIIKVLSSLLLGTTLIGFNGNATEVTIDMLVGTWRCEPFVEQFGEINHDKSALIYADVDSADSIGENHMMYSKIDETHIRIQNDDDYDSGDIPLLFKQKLVWNKVIDDGEIHSLSQYEYINHDEMVTTDNYEERRYDSNKKLTPLSFGYKYKQRCLRDK